MPNLSSLVSKAKIEIEASQDVNTLESIRIKFLGKKGYFSQQFIALRNLEPNLRASAGISLNKAKHEVKQAIAEKKEKLKQSIIEMRLMTEIIDVSLPGRRIQTGGLHPISTTISRIEHLFNRLGFSIITGPEIEDEYHNFDALNIPLFHPARADHDTFRFDSIRLLRTQTSSVQIRAMQLRKPPVRFISSGKVYRNDYDQTHTPMFHQMEGLIIDNNISFTNLKSTLYYFLHNFFEEDLKIRFRPSYFPFTCPSAEIDIMQKNGRWIEVVGCGMIHPNVLRNVSIDPETHSGFAFGIGIERLIMLHYDVEDLRVLFENDLRFLKQFK